MIDVSKIDEWEVAQKNMRVAKGVEMELRLEICTELAGDLPSGTHTFDIGIYKVKVANKLNYSIDKDIYLAIKDLLSEEEAESIRIKYELDMRNYKKSIQHEILDQAIVVKPGTPTLNLEILGE